MPELIVSIAELRRRLAAARTSASVALVPTMGALHEGHGRLMEHARRDGGFMVVSIFVNPLQFDRADDLKRYPRVLDRDLEFCSRLRADVVFAPPVAEMYPVEPVCTVEVAGIGDHLCGRHRPGHFRGVATVVLKLFQIVQPDAAYFGEKDAQQLAIIRRLVADLNVPTVVIGVPTVRQPDGLALSSRNAMLGAEDRPLALALYRALSDARDRIESGETDVDAITMAASAAIPREGRVRLEYLEVVGPDDMQPVTRITGPVCVAGALWVGATRLIDNLLCHPPTDLPHPASGSALQTETR